MPNSNLPEDLKQDWVERETVMPPDVNKWSEAINILKNVLPVYSSNGSVYTVTDFSENTFNLQPMTYIDDSQNNTPTSYIDGMNVIFKSNYDITGSCKVNVNSLGIKEIKKSNNSSLNRYDIKSGDYVWLVYNAEQSCFNFMQLPSNDIELINQSKALTTGNVSSNPDVYADVLERAHSTFDLSKFEIVGSPTITEHGVASGFSSSDYLKIPVNIYNKKFKISCTLNYTGQQTQRECIYQLSKENWANPLVIEANGSIAYFLSIGSSPTAVKNFEYKMPSMGVYTISLEWNETQYIFTIYNSNNEQIYQDVYASSEWLYCTAEPDTLFVGTSSVSGNYKPLTSNSIDLKQFSIEVDGIPVFNGNKTGLYVAKPDNYTVEGSPTITDDGVASGFSETNAIKINLPVSTNELRIKGKFTTGNDLITQQFIFGATEKNSNKAFSFQPLNNSFTYLYAPFSDDGNIFQQGTTKIKAGTTYYYDIIYKNNTIRWFYGEDENNLIEQIAINSIPAIAFDYLYVGTSRVKSFPFLNLIDLNSIKIYVDGNLIYQPCLKIPYTEAFKHSRVVDVAYRGRVQDLYEQTGEALFYTLDEQNQNFTLPMGDIYGMITKNREILDIVYPIGRPMPEENNVLLDNEVWLEGATVNIVDYSKLFKVYGTKYGGDGITTFVLPDMRGRVLWGSPDGSNGYIEAKLPNIKGGSVLHSQDADGALNGCFYTTRSSISGNAQFPSNGRSYATFGAGINANLSNEIYSDDATTVQPPAFKVRWKTRFE